MPRKRLRLSLILPTIYLLAVVVAATIGPWLVPHDPEVGILTERFLGPFWAPGGTTDHLLGTDGLGRDVFSRLIVGARSSAVVGLLATAAACFVGSTLGLVAGYFGGRVDAFVMRLADAAFSFPSIFLALLMAAVAGPSLRNLVLIIAVLMWARFARLVRGSTLVWKDRDFVALAQIAGARPPYIMFRHLVPNLANTILVVTSLEVGAVILVEASLSFLGVGVPPPTPAWGSMLADGRSHLSFAWWISTFPGAAIFLAVLSVNLLGDWLRDRLDPNLRSASP